MTDRSLHGSKSAPRAVSGVACVPAPDACQFVPDYVCFDVVEYLSFRFQLSLSIFYAWLNSAPRVLIGPVGGVSCMDAT